MGHNPIPPRVPVTLSRNSLEDIMLAQAREDYAHDRITMLELEERIVEILKREFAVNDPATDYRVGVEAAWQTQMVQWFNEPFVTGGCGTIIAPLIAPQKPPPPAAPVTLPTMTR